MGLRFSFYRDYYAYTGGHQKVRDYLEYTVSQPGTHVMLHHINRSNNASIFENVPGVEYQATYDPTTADVVFLAGMDWEAYLPLGTPGQLCINLIQHVRHAEPDNPLNQYLKQPAVRICVSKAVYNAVKPLAIGPCYWIPIGHDIPYISNPRIYDLYILATKQPELGERLYAWSKEQRISAKVQSEFADREQILKDMSQANVVVALPHKTEGFYLPAIEAMSLSRWLVLPDCVASNEYTGSLVNATVCEANLDSCINATKDALRHLNNPISRVQTFLGQRKAKSYSRFKEKRAYSELLNKITCDYRLN